MANRLLALCRKKARPVLEIIAKITDREILGTDGLSAAAPRYTVRAVLKNSYGLYAVIYAEKLGFYRLPGGGVENGEDSVSALKREIREETGCTCDSIEDIGCVYENRAHCNFTQYSYYYYVITSGPIMHPQLTSEEAKNEAKLRWLSFDETEELIFNQNLKTNQQKFLQASDLAALKKYL